MNMRHSRILVPGICAAAALALAMSAGAQTPPPGPTPATTSPHTGAMTGHHKASAAKARHDAEMKAECEAMMARKQEMQNKLQAMDATLDKLVAEMNAAKESKAVDALERPMAAVLNELVNQRKALRSLMMEMQPAMMEHMMHHMHMHDTKGAMGPMGAMECPMMKMDTPPKAEETKPPM